MARRRGTARALLASLLSLLFCTASVFAQSYRGTITGTIYDTAGAVVPDATVVATNAGTGVSRTSTTDSAGYFTIPELPVGTYSLAVSAANFQKAIVKEVTVEVSGDRRVEITLQSGQVSEEVVVTAEVPLVQTTTTELGGTLSGKQIDNLPLNGRDYQKALYLVPGSQGDPAGGADSPGSFGLVSSNGNRGRANNYLLDGTDMNDGYRNLPAINQGGVFGTPGTILPIEVIAETAIINNVGAQYGRNAGATVNIVTKSGGNSIHGSLYEFVRNDIFDARNVFNIDRDSFGNELAQAAFRNNQFGFSIGGPFVKNRTFWFVAYEGQRERVGLPSRARVPDPLEIQALGGASNPVIANLLALNPWPAPNIAPDANGQNLALVTPASNDSDSFIVKIDHSFNEKNQLTGRYFLGDSEQSFPLALLAGGVLPGFNTVSPIRVNLVALSYIHVVNDNLLNELRVGYNRYKQFFFAEDSDFDPRTIGLNTGVISPLAFGLPEIRVAGYASLGSNRGNPRGRIDTNWHLVDNVSWKVGRHDVKFGYEFRRTFVNGFFDAGQRGRLNFDSLEDFLDGRVASGRTVIGDSRRGTFQNNHGVFVEDSFQVQRNLVLNLGLRWDYYGVIGEERDRFSTFDPTVGLVQVDQLYDRDLNNFSPRLGVAWDVGGKGKTVVRAGWGVYFDAFSQDFFVGQLPWNTFSPGPGYNAIGPDPVLYSYDAVGTIVPGQYLFFGFTDSDAWRVDPELATPYVQNFNLNIQHEVFDGAVFEVGYVGSQGRKLFRYVDINQPPVPGLGSARPYDNGPFTPLGDPFYFVNNLETTAVSNYNALQVNFTVRERRGFSTDLNYTWSHSIDNASDGQDYVPNAAQPDDSFRTDLERASSNFDVRHNLTWSFTYRLPDWGDTAEWLAHGWSFNGIATFRSGNPFSPSFFDDFNGTGEFFVRPDLVGDPFAGTSTPDNFLNLSAFRVPCTLDADGACVPGTQHIGSLGRNALVGPRYNNFDFSVFKENELGENLRLQLRFEFYNILNHPNFASPYWPSFAVDASFNGIAPDGRGIGFLPITVTPDVGFGNPFLGGGGPRNIQFGVRLEF
jgi:hypothetical protein